MVHIMKDNGTMIKQMEKEYFMHQMALNTKEILQTINFMDMENLFLEIINKYIKDIFKTINIMDMEF